jgi:mono/diheme cytochrome c family protein
MKVTRRLAWSIVLVGASLLPPVVGAQEAPGGAGSAPQTDQQFRGEALFLKNCALCHIHTAQKGRLKIQASTELIGLFKRPTTTEDAVRRILQNGVSGLMPTFRYALSSSEMDDLIAYLKIR